jgi:hypothetical protein
MAGRREVGVGRRVRCAGVECGKSQASPEVFQRLAELHELIVQAEGTLADLNKEYAALKRKL